MAEERRGGASLTLFGATGDLAKRMLFPSLLGLERDNLLPDNLRIFASGHSVHTQDGFRSMLQEVLAAPSNDAAMAKLLGRISYFSLDVTAPSAFAELAKSVAITEERTFYLSTSPKLYGAICAGLEAAGLVSPQSRVVLEKPIGHDTASSRAVNQAVGATFKEESIFRVDHYLGKETVQNLMALRFANTIFEPLWNARAIDHVQITVGETLGVEERWDYYDQYGALRDMVQNHILQLLCLVAMEPPARFDPDSVRNEKVKVLRSLKPILPSQMDHYTVRGQYAPGVSEGRSVAGYAEEGGKASQTETFVALRADIANWRWAGTPFFLRTGKRMPERRTEIVIQFKDAPHSIFQGVAGADLQPNQLIIRLQPQEEVSLRIMNKAPGLTEDGMNLRPLNLNLSLTEAFGQAEPRRRIAYERLILDALHANSTLFVRRDEVEAAWTWIDPIINAWKASGTSPKLYASGSWGPSGVFALMERMGRSWNE